jgi:hypothetical protein
MHVVIRRYQGAVELINELSNRESEIRDLITGIDGFAGYQLVRTPDGGFSITTMRDKAGADESNRIAADWIKENIKMPLPGLTPQVTEGEAIFSFLATSEGVKTA